MLRYVSLTLIVASVVLAAPYFAFMCDGSRWEDVSMRGGRGGGGEGERGESRRACVGRGWSGAGDNRKAPNGEGEEEEAARILVTYKAVGLPRVRHETYGQQPAVWAVSPQARGSEPWRQGFVSPLLWPRARAADGIGICRYTCNHDALMNLPPTLN